MRSYRFGASEPVLTCTVLRACVIELETAETLVDDPIAGDQARWIITTAKTGRGGASTLVVVKPKACDVSTNLVLSTDRRIYDVDLDSPPCSARDTNPKRAYTRHITFTYPNESVGSAIAPASAPIGPAPDASEARDSSAATIAPPADSLNTKYRVVTEARGTFRLFRRKHSTFPWRPSAITDDGAHVYVSLPNMARKFASPVLYALEDDGSRTIVNYVVRDTVIVTDRVFRRGVLVIPNGKREETLVFENRAWSSLGPERQ
jgi:type IV secretion system protein VirB9